MVMKKKRGTLDYFKKLEVGDLFFVTYVSQKQTIES